MEEGGRSGGKRKEGRDEKGGEGRERIRRGVGRRKGSKEERMGMMGGVEGEREKDDKDMKRRMRKEREERKVSEGLRRKSEV